MQKHPQLRTLAGRMQRTDRCKYLGITILTDWQTTEHIKELNTRCNIINRKISTIGAKTQVTKRGVRVKLILLETCLMSALLYGLKAWKKLSKIEIEHLEKIQGKALKRKLNLPITKSFIGLITKRCVWPAEQRINYRSLILYHNIVNSSKDIFSKQIIKVKEHKTTKTPSMRK